MVKINEDNISHYLLSKQLIKKNQIVILPFYIESLSSRNNNYCAVFEHDAFMLKQVRDWDVNKIDTLRREACIYFIAEQVPMFSKLKKILPRFYDYNYEEHILVTEYLQNAVSAEEYMLQSKEMDKNMASKMGHCIGDYSNNIRHAIDEGIIDNYFLEKIPWVFDFGLADKKYYGLITNADTLLFDKVSREPIFKEKSELAHSIWEKNSLIHGDIKWMNFLVQEEELYIIDWEISDIGDIIWDLAGCVQSFLFLWMGRRSKHKNISVIDNELDICLHNLIVSFSKSSGIAITNQILNKLVIYSAYRLLQTSIEYAHTRSEFDDTLQQMFNLVKGFLENPENTIETFFGKVCIQKI